MCRPNDYPPYDPDAAPNRERYLQWLAENTEPVAVRVVDDGPWRGPTLEEWLARFRRVQ